MNMSMRMDIIIPYRKGNHYHPQARRLHLENLASLNLVVSEKLEVDIFPTSIMHIHVISTISFLISG
jgi:hypothetical protein